MNNDDVIKTMKEFEENVKYFDKNITGNPLYQGKFVVIDKKSVGGIFENEKIFSEALKELSKTAYASYVMKEDESQALNT